MVLSRRLRRVAWARATRIIADRHPPIDLFERVSPDPAVWDGLIAAEQAVNPRVRDEVGEIRLVPPEERLSGPGASWVMAAFTHLNPNGSRFSDGSYGVYYAARELRTAIRETAYHFGRFAADSADPPRYESMRVLVGRIDNRFADIAALPAAAARPHPRARFVRRQPTVRRPAARRRRERHRVPERARPARPVRGARFGRAPSASRCRASTSSSTGTARGSRATSTTKRTPGCRSEPKGRKGYVVFASAPLRPVVPTGRRAEHV